MDQTVRIAWDETLGRGSIMAGSPVLPARTAENLARMCPSARLGTRSMKIATRLDSDQTKTVRIAQRLAGKPTTRWIAKRDAA